MACHKDLIGDDLHIARAQTGAGNPNGSVTAGIVGELFWDTTNNIMYVAEATDDSSWIQDTGTGEANLAENIGTAGVGIFKDKTGITLNFKKLNAGSSKVTITDDTGNDEVDIDIIEGNIDHDALLNFIANEHIDHSAVNVDTEEGIQGGGDMTATRTHKLDINGLAEDTTPDEDTDFLVTYDASAAVHKKIKISTLPSAMGERTALFAISSHNNNTGDYDALHIAVNGNENFTFAVPNDFSSLVSLRLVVIPSNTDATADIDFNSDYAGIGEDAQTHSESDTTTTYSLVANQLFGLDISGVFSSISAGDYCGINVKHSGVAQGADYLAIKMIYNPA